MRKFSLEEVKYLNVEVLKKIRYKLQKRIYEARGNERVELETDHAYLSNYITMLDRSAKIHNKKYGKRTKTHSK